MFILFCKAIVSLDTILIIRELSSDGAHHIEMWFKDGKVLVEEYDSKEEQAKRFRELYDLLIGLDDQLPGEEY